MNAAHDLAERRREARRFGGCHTCVYRRATDGCTTCRACRKSAAFYSAQRRARLRALGLCVQCGEDAEGYALCAGHRELTNARARELRLRHKAEAEAAAAAERRRRRRARA